MPLVAQIGMDWMFANCSTTAERGALDGKGRFREATEPVLNELYDSVVFGREAEIVIEANSKEDYRVKLAKGVVYTSAGKHAQGVAYACRKLNIKATIFMPVSTPPQKTKQVKLFGKDKVEVVLKGDIFDDSFQEASRFCAETAPCLPLPLMIKK